PGSHHLDATVVFGLNKQQLQAVKRNVYNASCTSNWIITVSKLLHLALLKMRRWPRMLFGVDICGRGFN
ncbi:hypothetical protein ACVGWY_02575, partial [Enterobacter intestinihominis]